MAGVGGRGGEHDWHGLSLGVGGVLSPGMGYRVVRADLGHGSSLGL